MRALRPNREHVLPAADEQDGFTAGMASELAAVGKAGEGTPSARSGPLGSAAASAMLFSLPKVYTDRVSRVAWRASAEACQPLPLVRVLP